MDINSVIILGHTCKQPLMYRTSELVDGSEPHGHIGYTAHSLVHDGGVPGVGGVYPGWCSGWVPGRVLYRVLTRGQPEALFEAYLMNY